MVTVKGKIYVKGKRISASKANTIIYKAVENITMAGFTDAEQLYRMVMTNSNDNKAIANYVLVSMLEEYLYAMSRECERMFYESNRKKSTFNAMLHNQNIAIINETIGMIISDNNSADIVLYDEDDDGDDNINIIDLIKDTISSDSESSANEPYQIEQNDEN